MKSSPIAFVGFCIFAFLFVAVAFAKNGQDQIPAEDKIKIEYLKKVMVQAHQAPEPWSYRVVDIPSGSSASNVESKLNNLGANHQELVSITTLKNGNSRYVFKSRVIPATR